MVWMVDWVFFVCCVGDDVGDGFGVWFWLVCAVDDNARGSPIHCYTWSYLLLSCFLPIIIYPACSTFPIQPGLAGKDYTTYIYIHRFPETPRAEIFVAPCKPFDINTTCDRLLRAWSLCWFQGSCFCWFCVDVRYHHGMWLMPCKWVQIWSGDHQHEIGNWQVSWQLIYAGPIKTKLLR